MKLSYKDVGNKNLNLWQSLDIKLCYDKSQKLFILPSLKNKSFHILFLKRKENFILRKRRVLSKSFI